MNACIWPEDKAWTYQAPETGTQSILAWQDAGFVSLMFPSKDAARAWLSAALRDIDGTELAQ